MAIVNGSLQLGYKNTAWFTANASLVLLVGQIVYLEQTGTYKIGDGVTQLSALTFLGLSAETQDLQAVTDLGANTTNQMQINGVNVATVNDIPTDRKGADYFLKIGATTFDARYSTNATAFAATTQALAKDTMLAMPFIIEETMTFDRIGAEVTSAIASGVCSLLIYDSVNNVPTNLVLDAGTISIASATYQEISINKQLTAGLYFLVLWHNGWGNPSFRAIPIAACNKVLGLQPTLGTGNTYTRIYNSKVYTSAPLTYDLTGFTVLAANSPIISLRRSA